MALMQFVIEVHEEQLIAKIKQIENGIDRIISLAATDLSQMASLEGGQVSSRLGAHWPVAGIGNTRTISAPEFFAHFLAGGTAPHGPTNKTRLRFSVAGDMVFAQQVSGVPASHFDKRAVELTRGHMKTILERAIG